MKKEKNIEYIDREYTLLKQTIRNKFLEEENKKLKKELELSDSELRIMISRLNKVYNYINEVGKEYPNGRQFFTAYKCCDNLRSIVKGEYNKC